MSQKIHYATIIFPDHVYDEIQLLQKELSYMDHKIWSFSDTVKLLLQFCLEENDSNHTQSHSFLREHMCKRKSFLDDFTSSVFMSTYLTDFDRQYFD